MLYCSVGVCMSCWVAASLELHMLKRREEYEVVKASNHRHILIVWRQQHEDWCECILRWEIW